MEITIKLTAGDLQKAHISAAAARLMDAAQEVAQAHADVNAEITPPWKDGVPPMNKEPEEEEPKKPDFKALRSRVRVLGGELAKDEKSAAMIEVFKSFGAAKLSEIKDEDLEAVVSKLEVL